MTNPHTPTAVEAAHERDHEVPITIDGVRLVAPTGEITGAGLRQLATPPIGADRDLWLESPDGLDRLIGDQELIRLHPQMRFFTVPKVINPGGA